jgi:hypothetical protein
MSEKSRRESQVNMGIQANNVSGEVIAVGERATASKSASGDPQPVAQAIAQLQAALASLSLEPQAKAGIASDLAVLQATAPPNIPQAERAGHALMSLTARLKAVGVVLSEVVALSEPVSKIAEWLKVPLHLLGI